ncbi:MAG: NACHT domain-containing protein [Gammaproteobacteria bacterium]
MDPRLQPIAREYLFDADGTGADRALSQDELIENLSAGGLFLVWGEAGLGKTVGLAQIAAKLAIRKSSPTPLLVPAPSWARSEQTLDRFLFDQFVGSGGENASNMLRLMIAGEVAVFINGWNELAPEHVQRLAEQLVEVKLSAPGCPIVLSSRTKNGTDPLGPLTAFELAPLSTDARRAIVDRLAPDKSEKLLTMIEHDSEVDRLSRIPLFLVPIIDALDRGSPVPRTRHEILEAAVVSIERAPDHASALGGTTRRRCFHAALGQVAFQLSQRGRTEASRGEAESWLANLADNELTPAVLLKILIQHHVLQADAGDGIRFQHQYFQDWLCAHHLWQLTTTLDDDSVLARYLDDRRLSAAWALMVAALGTESAKSDAASIANRLFRIVLDVDLRLAAEWLPLLQGLVSPGGAADLKSRLRRWLTQGGCASTLALRAVLSGQLADFADEFWPLLESDDQQVRLSTYRLLEPFPIEVLGSGWRSRVTAWPPERRAEFATEATVGNSKDPLTLAKDFASRDPSWLVRGTCLRHIAFYDPLAARHLCPPPTQENIDEFLEHGTLELLEPEIVVSYLPHLEALARSDPLDERGRRALNYLTDIDPRRVLDVYKRQLSGDISDFHQRRQIFELVSSHDRRWAAEWVLERLTLGQQVSDECGAVLQEFGDEELQVAAGRILQACGRHTLANALIPFLSHGCVPIVRRCFDELFTLQWAHAESSHALNEKDRERLLDLQHASQYVPLMTLVQTAEERSNDFSDARSVGFLADLLSAAASHDPDMVPGAGTGDGRTLEALIRRLAGVILADEDEEGHRKAALARLVGLTHFSTLRDLLQQLVTAESTRVRQHFAERERGQRRGGGRFSHEHWYVSAVRQVAGPNEVMDLLNLFENDVFELEVGEQLARLVGIPLAGTTGGVLARVDWAAVAATHAHVGELTQSTDAQAAAAAIERHLLQWETRTDPSPIYMSREITRARLAIMYARITGRLRADVLLAVPLGANTIYTVERWLRILLHCGITIPSVVASRALDAWLAHVEAVCVERNQSMPLISSLLTALMFSDDLELAAERLQNTAARLSQWTIRDLLAPLAASAVPKQLELLLQFFPISDGDSYEYEWARVVEFLSHRQKRRLLEALLREFKWPTGLNQTSSVRVPHSIAMPFLSIVQSDQSLRELVGVVVRFSSDSPKRDFARALLVALGDREAAMTSLELAMIDPQLRSFAEAAIRQARWYRNADDRRIPDRRAPQALTPVRRALLRFAYEGDRSARDWASRLLADIEAALEDGYPPDEPRHPDLQSGFAWPIVDQLNLPPTPS